MTSNLVGIDSGCGNLTSVFTKPDEDLLIAGVGGDGLFGSRDGGNSWQPLGGPSDAGQIVNRPEFLVFDPAVSTRFWEAGIYGVSPFVTNDDGKTWTQLGNLPATDQIAVDFSDPDRKTLLAGGHEMAQALYRSTDSGMTWNNIAGGLPPNTNCTLPVIIDPQTYLVGCGGYPGPNGLVGVLRSTDAGGTWTAMTKSGGGTPPLLASDGAIYWVGPDGAGMTRSLDKGLTWTDVLGPNTIPTGRPVELPGKRIAVLGISSVIVSSDQGAHWAAASAPLPVPAPEYLNDASTTVYTAGLAYSNQRKAFYIWHSTCGFNGDVPVPSDAVMRYDFD